MALTVNTTASCKNIFIILNFTSSSTVSIDLDVLNAEGTPILNTPIPTFNIPPASGPVSYPIPLSDLSISNGLIDVVAYVSGTTNILSQNAVLVHCDIDCCLTKLTNELIDCACDCAKCASSLAKAQKVYLLITSADYAVVQANDGSDSARPGFIKDAKTKYLKAKEICDESCGCNC